jgi:hypothetical protein
VFINVFPTIEKVSLTIKKIICLEKEIILKEKKRINEYVRRGYDWGGRR